MGNGWYQAEDACQFLDSLGMKDKPLQEKSKRWLVDSEEREVWGGEDTEWWWGVLTDERFLWVENSSGSERLKTKAITATWDLLGFS